MSAHATADRITKGFMSTAEGGEYVAWPARGHEFWIKVSAEQTGRSLSVTENLGAANSKVGLHVHDRKDESFYVLEGEYHFVVGEQRFTATAGCLVFVPRGVPHEFTIGDRPGRVLLIFSPGGYEEVFREVGHAMATAGDVSEVFARLGPKHHTRFLNS